MENKKSLVLNILAPTILELNGLFLLGRKVVFNVELLANLFCLFAFDFTGHGLARHVQKTLNVQVVGGLDDIKEGALIEAIAELDVPLIICRRLLVILGCVLWRIVLVMLAVLENLLVHMA